MPDFRFSEDQLAIRDAVAKLCSAYGDEYWRGHDETGDFPQEFVADMAKGGWLGIAMPQEVGGAGLGLTEAA
jgi:acyl-CoA dehydrogenase